MDKTHITAAPSVTDRVRKTGGTVVIGPGPELDHAGVVQPNFAVVREAGEALQEEQIAILIRVVGEQCGGVDQEGCVLNGAESVVVKCFGGIVERPHFELQFQGRLSAAGIDHVVVEARRTQPMGREGNRARRGVERHLAIGCRAAVGLAVETHKAEGITLNVNNFLQELVQSEGLCPAQPNLMAEITGAGRIINR